MRLVVVESPYAAPTDAEVEENLIYARRCFADCLHRGEAPFGSHLLYTQPGILDDRKPEERHLGIEAGLAWAEKAERSCFYVDRGFSEGMAKGAFRATKAKRVVEVRSIDLFTGLLGERLLRAMHRSLDALLDFREAPTMTEKSAVLAVLGSFRDVIEEAKAEKKRIEGA